MTTMILEAKRKTAGDEPATEREVATEPEVATELTKAKTKCRISLKLSENFLYKIKNEEKIINEHIFRDYFLYQTSLYLTKHLYDSDEIKNNEIIENIINALIKLRKSIDSKEIPIDSKWKSKRSSQYCW